MLKIPVSSKDHIQGDKNAPITLLEYGDYECSYCGMAYPIIKQVQEYFGDQLRFVFRNFPLTQVHPHAEISAETAEFANDHKRFWEMHDLLYENQDRLSFDFISELVQALKLPLDEYKTALKNKTYLNKIREDFMGGVKSGVNGTPSFFINNQLHNGPFDFETLVFAIQQKLDRLNKKAG